MMFQAKSVGGGRHVVDQGIYAEGMQTPMLLVYFDPESAVCV